ncbi:hypothetical protein HMI55_003554 [Coelomomyces lativittatus]|nr:hypothetical protein HMI55_003554 [Coelomomyces lativittatus]
MPFSSSSSSSSTTTTSSFMNISGMHSLQQGAPPIHVVTSHSSTSSLDVASLERSPNTPTSFQSTHPSSSSSKRVQQWKAKWNETSERWKVKAHEKIKRVDEWTHSKGLAIGGGSSSSTSSSPNGKGFFFFFFFHG